MRKNKRLPITFISIIAVLALACLLFQSGLLPFPGAADEPPAEPDQVLETGLGEVEVFLSETAYDWGTEERRTYDFPNGDRFCQVRLTFSEDCPRQEVVLDPLPLPLGTMLRRYDPPSSRWLTCNPPAGELACGQYYFCFAGRNLMAVAPQAYLPRDNQMLEHVPAGDGCLRCLPLEDDQGWQASFCVPTLPGGRAEYFYFISAEDVLPAGDPEAMARWASYDFTGDNRWCYAGYYYRAPYNYVPNGPGYFHRLPAAYIAVKFAKQDEQACRELALAMLHVMLDLQNEQGFFPTAAESQWLRDDFGIGPGFYDTRFNSDLVSALLLMDQKYDVPEFAAAARAYGPFYLDLVERHHHVLAAADGSETWLAWDYYHPDGCLPSHCSLNHQIAELLTLFRLYDLTADPRYEELARRLLGGLFSVGEDWILPDGDLAYAYLPDGSVGMQDYPYLTYNDLLALKRELDRRYGGHDPVLDRIMEAKLSWMQAHGVDDYDR